MKFLMSSFVLMAFLIVEPVNAKLVCDQSEQTCKGYLLNRNSSKLLIYFRGISRPAPGNPITSALYDLQSVDPNINIFATKHHKYSLNPLEIGQLLRMTGASELYISSHSGGYYGLNRTLLSLRRAPVMQKIKGLFLLDNFYSSDTLAQTINNSFNRRFLNQNCYGFTTPHNRKRYDRYYRQICNKNKFTHFIGGWHNKAVNKCLRSFLAGKRCSVVRGR